MLRRHSLLLHVFLIIIVFYFNRSCCLATDSNVRSNTSAARRDAVRLSKHTLAD